MKRIFILLLILAMIVTVSVACKKDDGDVSDGDSNVTNTQSETDSESDTESDTQAETKKKEDATVVTGEYTPFY